MKAAFFGPGGIPRTHYPRVWFGPPGVGKSTFVKAVGGVDLETDPYDAIGPQTRDIGAASTRLSEWPGDRYVRILVLPPREKYDIRRKLRDRRHPEKAGQGDFYDGFAADASAYDHVLEDFPLTPAFEGTGV